MLNLRDRYNTGQRIAGFLTRIAWIAAGFRQALSAGGSGSKAGNT